MSNYTPYHVHTYYSLLDSCTSPSEYVNKAVELGQTAIAFTEHGNIFNWFEKKKLCDAAGIKYLHGIECYVTENLEPKVRDNWHTILIAKNYEGFKEINNLFFTSYQKDHTYYKHRITIDEFLNISDNVIKISACIQSPIYQMRKSILASEDNKERKLKHAQMVKHYDYYEIQYHNFPEQIEYNKFLYKLSKKYNKPLIAGTDTHNLNDYKGECRTMLQYGKTDGAWGEEENDCDLSYKSYDELVECFKRQNSLPLEVVLEAIENTNVMADSVEELVIDTHNKYPFLYGEDDEKVMWNVLKKNYKSKLRDGIITDSKEYIDNIKEEMAVFKKTNMVGFMLFMSELMTWAKDNDIATGSARGSVAGSTVAFISNITDVDPIKWHTIFSRFCNEYRVEIGDIDTDWYEDDRQKIFDYIINRFGTQKTGYVFAVGTLADKAVIDVIGKAFRIKAEKTGTTTCYTLAKIKEIKAEYSEDPEGTKVKYPDLFYYYDGLVNCVVSQSQHPAGIIASPINLIDFCGAFIGENGQQILPLDMDCCHDTGLVKYDILGLKTVGVIDKTCKLIGKKYPKVHEIDFDDEEVFKDMSNDSTTIFQFESNFAKQSIKKMQPRSVEDICLCSACLRPSGESYREQVFDRRWNKNPSKLIDNVLANSYGFLCIDGDQLMPTTKGIKKIKDIVVGDEVYTHKGVNVVNKVYDNGIKEVYKLTTRGGEICCTDNHKILTQYGWVELKNIMQNPKKYCVATKVNDYGQNDYNKDLLKMLAWFIGDGILHQSKGHKNCLGFVNTNLEVINSFCKSVENVYGNSLVTKITERETRVNKLPIYYVAINWKQPFLMRGNEKPITTFLKECNIFNHLAQEKVLPSFLFNLNKECILTFLGAYSDTDCHIDEKSIVYHCSSYELMLGIQELYRKLGFSSSLNKNSERDFTLSITNVKNALYMLKDYSLSIKQKGLGLSKSGNNTAKLLPISYVSNHIITNKQKVFTLENKKVSIINCKYVGIDFLRKIKENKKYSNIIQFNEYTSDKNINWSKIKSVEYVGQKEVYDLEINNVHDFALCGGLIVHNCYQEQTIAFLQQVCGFNGSDADNVRRAIGRKKVDELNKALPKILDGYCSKSDKPREEAEKEALQFLKIIEDSSSYQFGFNHSIAYSILSYLCGYFRHYYPVEYCTSYLNCAKNDDDILNGTELAKGLGIEIRSPQFGYSQSEYSCDSKNKVIYKGLSSIKGLSESLSQKLYNIRDKKYDNFVDLLKDFKDYKITDSAQLDTLTKIDFFSKYGEINDLLNQVKIFNFVYGKKQFKVEKIEESGLPLWIFQKHSGKVTDKMMKDFNDIDIINDIIANIEKPKTSMIDILKYQQECLGYISYVRPDLNASYCFVTEINKNRILLYSLCNGAVKMLKIRKKTLENNPVEPGNIINVLEIKSEGKWYMDANGAWCQKTDEFDEVLSKYNILKTKC